MVQFFLPPSSSPCPPFTVGCNHICWTMITPLLLFLFFLVFVFSLPPSLLQGGSRLLRQRSREIACYRGSIFHALVNCFVLTLCQSGVVTPAWATRNPAVVLMISGCFHQDCGGQEGYSLVCVCVCVRAVISWVTLAIHEFLLGLDKAFILGQWKEWSWSGNDNANSRCLIFMLKIVLMLYFPLRSVTTKLLQVVVRSNLNIWFKSSIDWISLMLV